MVTALLVWGSLIIVFVFGYVIGHGLGFNNGHRQGVLDVTHAKDSDGNRLDPNNYPPSC